MKKNLDAKNDSVPKRNIPNAARIDVIGSQKENPATGIMEGSFTEFQMKFSSNEWYSES